MRTTSHVRMNPDLVLPNIEVLHSVQPTRQKRGLPYDRAELGAVLFSLFHPV